MPTERFALVVGTWRLRHDDYVIDYFRRKSYVLDYRRITLVKVPIDEHDRMHFMFMLRYSYGVEVSSLHRFTPPTEEVFWDVWQNRVYLAGHFMLHIHGKDIVSCPWNGHVLSTGSYFSLSMRFMSHPH